MTYQLLLEVDVLSVHSGDCHLAFHAREAGLKIETTESELDASLVASFTAMLVGATRGVVHGCLAGGARQA